MRTAFNASLKLPDVILSRQMNAQNGNDAEILSASTLIQALNAEVRWGSRNEDNSKIDLFLSFDHPWLPRERVILLAQIKSGPSYGAVNNGRLKLYKRSFKEVKRIMNNICLVWINQNEGENYWSYIHPNSNSKVTEYGRNHLVTPALRFELARCLTRDHSFNIKGGKGIILDFKLFHNDFSTYRKNVKNIYRQSSESYNPLFGNVSLTGFGWNHMFRKSRELSYKTNSLFVIPYLKTLLKRQPSRYWINRLEITNRKDYEFSQSEYVLFYEGITTNTGKSGRVTIKLIEEIGFPISWKSESLLSQRIIRHVILKSCSWKEI